MGRASAIEKEATRRRLLEAAGRGFRAHGFGGLGVDAVAKDAGVTSGAFYANFGSKAEVFRAILDQGLTAARDGIAVARTARPRWLRRFAKWYLSPERRADIANSCALPTLTLEAARSDDATRDAYSAHLRAIVKEVQAGLPGPRREGDAIAILALLCGGMTLAHAVSDERLGARIAQSVADAIERIGDRPTDHDAA